MFADPCAVASSEGTGGAPTSRRPPLQPSAEPGCDHSRRRADMHVEVEVQECALQLLIAASRRSDVDWTVRRRKHVLVRRRWRLRASRENREGRTHERQRQQDYKSPHRSTFRRGLEPASFTAHGGHAQLHYRAVRAVRPGSRRRRRDLRVSQFRPQTCRNRLAEPRGSKCARPLWIPLAMPLRALRRTWRRPPDKPGGLEVPSSNLGAPTEINGVRPPRPDTLWT